MSEQEEQVQRAELVLTLAPELEQGVYANFLNVQSGQWDFVLTFHQVLAPRPHEPTRAEARGVARVVVPAGLIDRIMATLRRAMAQHEELVRAEEKGGGESGSDTSG